MRAQQSFPCMTIRRLALRLLLLAPTLSSTGAKAARHRRAHRLYRIRRQNKVHKHIAMVGQAGPPRSPGAIRRLGPRTARPVVVLGSAASLVLGLLWARDLGTPIVISPLSASVPPAVYRVLPDHAWSRGALVLFMPPAAAHRAWLGGRGPRSRNWWIKMVAGLAGDTVCALDTALTVNGTVIAEVPPPALAPDRPALRGCEVVAPGMVYLAGLHPRSLDSRYWGPVDNAAVVAKVEPLFALDEFVAHRLQPAN